MGAASHIEWTEATWNPVTGCTKISAGCKNCYAERLAHRLKAMGQESYRNGFELTLQEHALELPLRWKRPQTIFVNSMSDLFHKDVPLAYIRRVFDVMERAHWHRFQVLTKRADRLEEIAPELVWPKNVWMGVSVEDQRVAWRIDHLRRVPAAVRFLSLEPLIGPLDNLDLNGIHWAIVGGESGPGCRPMQPEWVRSIRDQCAHQQVSFFFKQWGGTNKKAAGRELDGRTYDDMPEKSLRKLAVQELISAVILPQPTEGAAMSDKRIYVERRPQGDYAIRRPNAERASAVETTQAAAIQRARELAPDAKPHIERVRNTSKGERDKFRKG